MTKKTIKTPAPVDCLAAETGTGATQRERFPDRLTRYGKARANALEVLEFIVDNYSGESQHARLIHDMRHCGNYLLFRDYYTVGEIRLSGAYTCQRHLLCQFCAIRRGARLVQDYHTRYEQIMRDNPSLTPYLVTFTVKDGVSLSERFSALSSALRQYHRRRSRKNASCEALKASAAVWSYEVKRGKNSGLWHPHVHAVWLCEHEPDQLTIRSEWASIMADGSFMVDVRPIDTADPVTGFLEVFKYATKFSDQPAADTWHTFETLRGRRLIGSFGAFRGIKEPDTLTDEPLPDELPYIERLYRYSAGQYHSAQRQH